MNELLNYSEFSPDVATSSAFVQQREKNKNKFYPMTFRVVRFKIS